MRRPVEEATHLLAPKVSQRFHVVPHTERA
jgi:hypothetical protein